MFKVSNKDVVNSEHVIADWVIIVSLCKLYNKMFLVFLEHRLLKIFLPIYLKKFTYSLQFFTKCFNFRFYFESTEKYSVTYLEAVFISCWKLFLWCFTGFFGKTRSVVNKLSNMNDGEDISNTDVFLWVLRNF